MRIHVRKVKLNADVEIKRCEVGVDRPGGSPSVPGEERGWNRPRKSRVRGGG